MASQILAPVARTPARQSPDDPLAYLHCSSIAEFRRGQAIYGPLASAKRLYVVIEGQVQVSRVQDNGRCVAIDIYQQDDFFGEAAFVQSAASNEVAVALSDVKVMMWTAVEVENRIVKQPQLGIALAQMLERKITKLSNRLVSFSTERVAVQLARTLLDFAERFGYDDGEGYTRMPPVKHSTLAEFLGTSREIVTLKIREFKAAGYVCYSRKSMSVSMGSLRGWLRSATERSLISAGS
jgi:CRP-like cAMP-binding protein